MFLNTSCVLVEPLRIRRSEKLWRWLFSAVPRWQVCCLVEIGSISKVLRACRPIDSTFGILRNRDWPDCFIFTPRLAKSRAEGRLRTGSQARVRACDAFPVTRPVAHASGPAVSLSFTVGAPRLRFTFRQTLDQERRFVAGTIC
jgi:hypothetical protein